MSSTLAAYNFLNAAQNAQWGGLHGIGAVRSTAQGLRLEISGEDPYLTGPPLDLPRGVLLWAHLRIYSKEAGDLRLYYWNATQNGPSEERVAYTYGSDKGWQDILIPLPALGPQTRFRVDPAGGTGSPAVTLASLFFTARNVIPALRWPIPTNINIAQNTPLQLKSGAMVFRHNGKTSQGFTISVGGQSFARGLAPTLLGIENPRGAEWINTGKARTRVTKGARGANSFLREVTTTRDKGGATWRITREYSPSSRANGFEVVTRVRASLARRVAFLPLLVVLPGAGSFGAKKNQAVFSGLEYLAKNEPSSSKVDIITNEHRRRVPLAYKITIPLMAVQANNKYLALAWQPQDDTAALFDSPDRTFKSGAHVMGVIMPGAAQKTVREDGNLLPYSGALLQANREYSQRSTIFGGSGNSIVPAVKEYVARRGLPALPERVRNETAYINLAERGWLNSRIRENDLVRHAFWAGFSAAPSADAPLYMEWLAIRSKNPAQAARLRSAARATLATVDPKSMIFSTVSHVAYPLAPLVFGSVTLNAREAAIAAGNGLRSIEAGGTRYTRKKGQPDYSRGNGSPYSNGLTATSVRQVLEFAAFSGDKNLIARALQQVRRLDKYMNDVPRGAQPWEVPLHSPDILASAHLMNCYTLGYELTRDPKMLERARYWAWTGVPFVYLTHPTKGKTGIYSTIAVFGATTWVGSWFGRPVQWCGLVYSDALRRLADYDNSGPWMKLADGITLSGIEQTWPASDTQRQGLLPDFFLLNPQVRDGPAINPGTVQANVVPLFTGNRLYDFRALRTAGFLIHAPGKITISNENARSAAFTVSGWPTGNYYVLISGLPRGAAKPKVTINNAMATNTDYDASAGRLVLTLNGNARINIAK